MITTDNPQEAQAVRRVLNRQVLESMPAEKAAAREEQTRIAQKLHREGSRSVEGIGQKIGSIDRRTFFRLHQENPGCWQDADFVNSTLRDSPKLRAASTNAGSMFFKALRTVRKTNG